MTTIHDSWNNAPSPTLLTAGASFAEQLIRASSHFALHGTLDGSPGEANNRFPWFFIEVNHELLKRVAERAEISVPEFLATLNEALPKAVQTNSQNSIQEKLYSAFGTLNSEALHALIRGSAISDATETDSFLMGRIHGQETPPWQRAGRNSQLLDQFAKCLDALLEFTSDEFSSQLTPVIPMAWAAYIEPTLLFTTGKEADPHIKSGVYRSALAVSEGSMDVAKRQKQARETWGEFRRLTKDLLQSEPFRKWGTQTSEIQRLVADALPDKAKLMRAILCTQNLRAPFEQWQKDNQLYPRGWDEAWGKDRCVPFLEALRNANRNGVPEDELESEIGEKPSRIVGDMARSKNLAKVKLSEYLKKLRDRHSNGRYYLYVE